MRRNTLRTIARIAAVVGTVAMTGTQVLAAPVRGQQIGRYIDAVTPKPRYKQLLTPEEWQKVEAAREKAAQKPSVRPLTLKEMAKIKGRGNNRKSYLTGTMPWHRSLRDVNLCTGNLFKSFTDIQIAPGRGAGLVMQRTYNSNEDRVGPFGKGWTHAYDIRIEEEGLSATTGEEKVGRNDFFGGEHKYTRDADGLYTPPPYLFDEMDSRYGEFLANGPDTTIEGQKVLEDTQRTMDGTEKHFIAGGLYKERVCDKIKDRYGNETVLTYNTVTVNSVPRKEIDRVTDPTGRYLLFTWSDVGSGDRRITQIAAKDQSNNVLQTVTYEYYQSGDAALNHNLWKVNLDPGGGAAVRTTTYAYTTAANESGLLSSISDPLGHTVSYSYGIPTANFTGSVWVTGITEPGSGGNHVWTITTSDGGGDPRYSVVASSNGGLGVSLAVDTQLRKRWYSLNNVYLYETRYQSDTNNVTYQSSAGGWLSSFSNTSGSSTDRIEQWMTYGPHGNVLAQSFYDIYTNANQPKTVTEYGNASKYFQKTKVTDPQGRTTEFVIGSKTDTSNGNKGSVLKVRDAGYAVSGEPSYGKEYVYTYNTYGQKTQETNLKNVVTQYTYGDAWNNLTQVVQDYGTGKLNRTTTMEYDASGRVLESTDPASRISEFTYNKLGQPLTAYFPAANGQSDEEIEYAYADNGRLVSVEDNRGVTTLAYETGNDRVSSVTDPVTGAISYSYGLAGERGSMTLPGGGTWNYNYGRTNVATMLSSDDPDSISKALAYIEDDGNGQGTGRRRVDYYLDATARLHEAVTNQSANAHIYTKYTFDGDKGWLNEVKSSWRTQNMGQWTEQKVFNKNVYTHYEAGNRNTNAITRIDATMNQNTETWTETYTYDPTDRLKTVDYSGSQTQSYTFDAMGNRATKVNNGTSESYTYNNANMLLTRGSTNYTNDVNGNTLTDGTRTNTWDSQNRLVQCVKGNDTSSFVYGADGQRRQSSVNGTTTDYVLDNSMFIRERRGANNHATYLVGPQGPEYRREDSTNTVSWYIYDGLGSVVSEVDSNGSVTTSRKYDIYGSVRSNTGTGTSKHKFVGKLGHPDEGETGLIYMRARYYDPAVGRFVSQDPGQHGKNWFAYCGNNPVNLVDENGKEDKPSNLDNFLEAQPESGFTLLSCVHNQTAAA